MLQSFADHINMTLAAIEADGFPKRERAIAAPQSAHILSSPRAQDGQPLRQQVISDSPTTRR